MFFDTTGARRTQGTNLLRLELMTLNRILLPIARWRFFTHPALKNAETRQAVKMEYDDVMLTLRNGSVFEPSVAANHASYI